MASPVGHVLVGFAAAAATAQVVGAEPSPQLWLGVFVASGLPDLDFVPAVFGIKGPHVHRNGSHSLLVFAGAVVTVWLVLRLLSITLPSGTMWVVSVALLSHPLVDVVTTGPGTAARGYGIALLWPLSRKRWYLNRPVFETADFSKCKSVGEAIRGVVPEIVWFGPPSVVVLTLTALF